MQTAVAADRVTERRLRFRTAVSRLSDRARSTELLRLVLVPGAVAIVGGFAFMILAWYGAAHTTREIEQVPYLISGGLIGLGLVLVGIVVLSSAMWLTMLRRFQEESDERVGQHLVALEERLRAAAPAPRPPARRAPKK